MRSSGGKAEKHVASSPRDLRASALRLSLLTRLYFRGGYSGLDQKGYQREVTVLRGRRKEASRLMPRVHRIAGLLKRWLLGTHQGAVAPQHLSYYLDEFTFRFNRRRSKSRGKLFFRLMQQAVGTSPKTYDTLIGGTKTAKRAAQQLGVR